MFKNVQGYEDKAPNAFFCDFREKLRKIATEKLTL